MIGFGEAGHTVAVTKTKEKREVSWEFLENIFLPDKKRSSQPFFLACLLTLLFEKFDV